MALIRCEECNKEISDKAKACIHCGCPVIDKDKIGLVTVKYKLPKNQALTALATEIVDWNTKKVIDKIKVENTITFRIDKDTPIKARQIFLVSNLITLDSTKESKVIITFAGALNQKLVINEVDSFID